MDPHQQQQKAQQKAFWAGADPNVLVSEIRERIYQNPQVSNDPELLSPLEELCARFDQTLRATGVGSAITTSGQASA